MTMAAIAVCAGVLLACGGWAVFRRWRALKAQNTAKLNSGFNFGPTGITLPDGSRMTPVVLEALRSPSSPGLRIEREDGVSLTLGPDGGVSINLAQLKAVSIRNILDVKHYGMSVVDGITMHVIEFKNGGMFELTYDSVGTISNCGGNSLRTEITGGDTMIVGPSDG
jgi:hypothetical protein